MNGLFDYFVLFSFAFFGVLAIVLVIRIFDIPKFLQVHTDNQQKHLESIHAELKLIRQELERR